MGEGYIKKSKSNATLSDLLINYMVKSANDYKRNINTKEEIYKDYNETISENDSDIISNSDSSDSSYSDNYTYKYDEYDNEYEKLSIRNKGSEDIFYFTSYLNLNFLIFSFFIFLQKELKHLHLLYNYHFLIYFYYF